MSKEKIKIASTSNGYPYWGPLMPIVEFCLQRGCILDYGTPEKPFHEDRDGVSSCRIVGPVTVPEILKHFELPDHYDTDDVSINYSKFRSYIHLMSEKEHKVVLKERAERKERFDKRLLSSRKRRAERNKLSTHDEDQ